MTQKLSLQSMAGSHLLAELTPVEIDEFGRYLEYRKFVAGAAIFLENMEGEYLYLILKGTVKVSRMLSEGKEKLLVVLGPEDLFGEMALFNTAHREATARVMEEAYLATLSREKFDELCRTSPRLALKITLNIVRVFSRRVRASSDDYRAMLQAASTTT